MKICSSMMTLMFICLTFVLLIMMLSISTKMFQKEKMTPFECGFSSMSSAGVSFSMPFFILSLIFLMFDVEVLILCMKPIMPMSPPLMEVELFFVVSLILGSTFMEWAKGMLTWT